MGQSKQKLFLSRVMSVAVIGLPSMLIGCTQLPAIDTSTSRLITLNIQTGETADTLASKYDAKVLTFHPETGEAVLALTKDRAARLSREAFDATDPNENTLESQQQTSTASAVSSNMSGWTGHRSCLERHQQLECVKLETDQIARGTDPCSEGRWWNRCCGD